MEKLHHQLRIYKKEDCIPFRKTKEKFGGLSNMASGYSLIINGNRIRPSEALYQACRYPLFPEIQKEIIIQRSPMTAKMKSKKYYKKTRQDWEDVRFKIMKWCIEIKLFQNWDKFSTLLAQTENKPIVEDTPKNKIWGAVLKEGKYEGVNALGRLLMELRNKYVIHHQIPNIVPPPKITGFLLYGEFINGYNLSLIHI